MDDYGQIVATDSSQQICDPSFSPTYGWMCYKGVKAEGSLSKRTFAKVAVTISRTNPGNTLNFDSIDPGWFQGGSYLWQKIHSYNFM